MGTMTAQLLFGGSHPYHGGITPSMQMFVSENSRPALILGPVSIFHLGRSDPSHSARWVPTLENTLHDAVLMMSAYILSRECQDERFDELLDMMSRCVDLRIGQSGGGPIELYSTFTPEQLDRLYAINKTIIKNHYGFKVMVSILEQEQGSLIQHQISQLLEYGFHVEVLWPRPVEPQNRGCVNE